MQVEGMFMNETFSYSVFKKQGLHEVEDIGLQLHEVEGILS
jgi:hypothetical protein